MKKSKAWYFIGLLAVLALAAAWLWGYQADESSFAGAGRAEDAAGLVPTDTDALGSAPSAPASPGAEGFIDAQASIPGANTTSQPSRWQALRKRMAEADALPVEGQFIADNAVSLPRVQAHIAGERFDQLIDQLRRESQSDPLAQELNDTYREAIGNQLASEAGALAIDRFACGLRVCIGSMRSAENVDAWSRWSEVFDRDPSTPHRVFVDFSSADQAGGQSHRFVFSTDDSTDSVRASPHH